MEFTSKTSIYKKKLEIRLLNDLKFSFFEYINFKAKRNSSFNLKDIEKSVFELFDNKLLGLTLNEFNNSKNIIIFKDQFKVILSNLIGEDIYDFPINVIRIFHPKINVNKLNWHQDEATWNHNLRLRKKYPFTFWIPILTSNFSTLSVEKYPRKKIYFHSYEPLQGRFKGQYKSKIKDDIMVCKNVKKGDFVSFSSATFHKTWIKEELSLDTSKINDNFLRISVDLRFIMPNSANLKKNTNYSNRLKLLALKNKLVNYF